ncbi:MAG TPA: nucleotidyltransferase domain-containing protein [Terriglobia bacterium]|nr:nucleotidyltransferase domain-containing protein [Terriglobia bacterium]
MEKQLSELVEKLKAACGANLKSVVLYGSAATDEFHAKFSDLNVMCVLERLTATDLEKLNPPGQWWSGKGHPAPMIFTLEGLRTAADVFAIEFLDIKAKRRVLLGEDVFADLDVPMSLHGHQVEREIRVNLIRLRQSYVANPPEPKILARLMTASISSFVTLFHHALIALGELPPHSKREAADRLGSLLGFDSRPFHTILDVREKKLAENQLDAPATFRAYFESIQRAEVEYDRRMK